MIERIIDS